MIRRLIQLIFRAIGVKAFPVGQWPAEKKIVVANHVSYLDGPLLAAFIPERLACPVDTDFSRKEPWRTGLRLMELAGMCEVVPACASNPISMRNILHRVKKGESVCIFPQGGICPPDEPVAFERGASWLHAAAPNHIIQAVRIEGAGETIFGRAKRKRLRPSITLSTRTFERLDEAEAWLGMVNPS